MDGNGQPQNGDGGHSVNNTALTPRQRQLAGLRPPWPKGVSGNPQGGRLRLYTNAYEKMGRRKLTKKLRERLIKKGFDLPVRASIADGVAAGMHAAAISGFAPAAREIADRVEGPVVKPVELTGAEGGPLQIELAVVHIGMIATSGNGNNGTNGNGHGE